jgi:hypothetical protein
VSGRVGVNKYVERRIIPVARKKKPYNCTHDKEDLPFFLPASNTTALPAPK